MGRWVGGSVLTESFGETGREADRRDGREEEETPYTTRSLSHACVGAYYYDPREKDSTPVRLLESTPRIDVHAHSCARASASQVRRDARRRPLRITRWPRIPTMSLTGLPFTMTPTGQIRKVSGSTGTKS